MTMGPDGAVRLEGVNMSLEGLADLLGQLLRQTVVDMTGLRGRYQIVLEIPHSAATNDAAQPQAGAISTAPVPVENPVFAAVQKLGLRLEARKMPVEIIVVDHLERAPAEN